MIARMLTPVVAVGLTAMLSGLHAEPPSYLSVTERQRGQQLRNEPWLEIIRREVEPLQNDPGDRMPMIMWHGVGYKTLTEDQITVLRQRGLTQHLPISERSIQAARALQNAGMPVVLMEGRTDAWPYSLAGDREVWAHQFDLLAEDPSRAPGRWHGACPLRIQGWERLESSTRQLMQSFKQAGVTVDAVWADYEGDPYPWSHLFDQIRSCRRCRYELPKEVVENKDHWRSFCWQQYVFLYDEYFARPIREVFPDCSVTNWHVVHSSRDHPVRYFVRDVDLPVLSPTYFNASNPIAYGSDLVWNELGRARQLKDSGSIDDFYAEQLMHQVVSDRINREATGTAHAVPWVARICKIEEGPLKAPVMSRQRYRQTLAEIWDQGVRTMQVFNAMHDGYEELALIELQDAVAAYDESLAEN